MLLCLSPGELDFPRAESCCSQSGHYSPYTSGWFAKYLLLEQRICHRMAFAGFPGMLWEWDCSLVLLWGQCRAWAGTELIPSPPSSTSCPQNPLYQHKFIGTLLISKSRCLFASLPMLHKLTLALPLRKNELKEEEEKTRPFSRGHRISQISISRCLLQPFIPLPGS